MNKLFVLSGPSGSGKSSLLLRIVNEGLCERAPKYSSRKERDIEDDIIYSDDLNKCSCDIIYERYNNMYGINTSEIKNKLLMKNQIVVISDIDSISKIKDQFFKDISVTIFLYLQDLRINNLLKNRYKLELSKHEMKILSKHILRCRKMGNINWQDSINKDILDKIKISFSNNYQHYKEFISRCDSWIKLDDDYKRYTSLFTKKISGRKTDEMFMKLCKIIKEETR